MASGFNQKLCQLRALGRAAGKHTADAQLRQALSPVSFWRVGPPQAWLRWLDNKLRHSKWFADVCSLSLQNAMNQVAFHFFILLRSAPFWGQNRKLAKSCRDQVTSPDVGETASASETETSPVNVSELSDLGTSAEQSASGLSEAPHPRRPVPRAQTWHMAPTPAARVPFFRAHTWQNSPNLQSVPEGLGSKLAIF